MGKVLHAVVSVVIVEFQHPAVIGAGVVVACGTAADQALVVQLLDVVGEEGDVGGEAHGEALGQLAVLLDVLQEGGHIPGTPLGGGVQGNAHELVIDEGVIEPVLDGGGEVAAVLLIQGQDGHNLLQEHLVHVAQNGGIVHAVPDDVKAAEIRAQNEAGVGAVEDADLALFVGGHVGGHKDLVLKARLAEGQHVVELLVALDNPHAEHFAHVQQGVLIAVLLLQLRHFLGVADAAGNDAVHQGAAEGAVLIDVLLKAVAQLPLVDVLVDAL